MKCLHTLSNSLFHCYNVIDSIYLNLIHKYASILRLMLQLVAGTTHFLFLLSSPISKLFLSSRYLSLWTNLYGRLMSSWQFCHHEGTFTILTLLPCKLPIEIL